MARKHTTLKELFADCADAIRSKSKTTSKIAADDFPDQIRNISTGSDVSGVTAVAGDVRSGKKFVASNGVVTSGTLGNASLTLNDISISNSGLITASANLSAAGIVTTAPSSKTKQLSTRSGDTFTPYTYNRKIINAGTYCTGDIYVGAIPSDNLRKRYSAQVNTSYNINVDANVKNSGTTGSVAWNAIEVTGHGFEPKAILVTYSGTSYNRLSWSAFSYFPDFVCLEGDVTGYASSVSISRTANSAIQISASKIVLPVARALNGQNMLIEVWG